jgi:N-acetylmuramoyl-L-alanine amidase
VTRVAATLACLLALAARAAPAVKVIVVDPGHGGTQEGALGPGGLKEKEISLQIARRLKGALERTLHAQVLLTREKDTLLHLSERVAIANEHKPDLFVSVHANSMPTQRQRARAEGIETFFLSANASDEDARKTADRENAEVPKAAAVVHDDTLAYILADLQRAEAHVDSSRLAYAVHQRLVAATRALDRGVQQAPFYVLMGVEAPAILVEVGFISHPKEGKRLTDPDYQETLAIGIAEGVDAFLQQINARDAERVASPK